jgi:probable F420-dependent oxidoreductase
VKFFQSLQFAATEDLLTLARLLEEQTSFDGAFLGDHWLYPEKLLASYPYSADGKPAFPPQAEWPHIGATLGALAAATTRLEFTTSIIALPLYSPVDMAKMMATLSVLSGQRVSLGIGVGWMEDEFRATGIDFPTRGKRTDEMIEVMRLLWTGDMVEFHGRFFDFPRMMTRPKPLGRVPLHVSGYSSVSMRRAVNAGDGWISGSTSQEKALEYLPKIRAAMAEAGRDDGTFELIALARSDLDFIKRLQDLGVTTVYNYSSLDDYAGLRTTRQKADDILRYSDEIISKF